ncbi:jg17194 [Pararge aegeria aegeria]|uniref:Jg17194 protein n=1 Tax=Pararge aegeria aegeria TaxID=348720 RepID=A0A8S4SJG7_9NEOP|nr:jg17194 [Pararge aegeria aegeria]
MVSRSLTEVFVLMRNNAIHSRQIFAEQGNESERVRLMRSSSHDLEMGSEIRSDCHDPPPWADALEEAHYIITRLRSKLAELRARHEQQLRRPALDDRGELQHIERLSADISLIPGNKSEQKLATNVVLALVTILQELSVTFRSAQSNYLKSLTSREERSNAYFDLPNFEELSLQDELLPGLTSNQTDLLFSLPSTSTQNNHYDDENSEGTFQKQNLNQKQLLLMQEENTKMVAEREEEVNKIVKSIVDLNDIFKDLGHMVHEQGTVLDRIDYNIEQTQVQVHEGYKQLQKAERFQRQNRKMHCIMVLAVTVVLMVILLILVKS